MEIKKVPAENPAPAAKIETKSVEKDASKDAKAEAANSQNPSAQAKRYVVGGSTAADAQVSAEAAKLNEEIKEIEKKTFSYQDSVDELKKEIDNTSSDPDQMYAKITQLNELKYEIMEAETQRISKMNELKTKLADGSYNVSGRDIVDKMSEE
jgi:predicted RNase H-like nuclease (RuvC/YqgF family)